MKVIFNKELYNKKAIEKAIEDYSQFASFKLKEEGDCFVVSIDNVKDNFEVVIEDEFCNYALGLMKSRIL